MNLVLGLLVLWSVFTLNCAILTAPKSKISTLLSNVDTESSSSRKEKRGVFGIGVHAHHNGYAPNYDEWAHNNHHHAHPQQFLPSHPPLPPHPHHVNLGAHFHTTVTKKIGIPLPYPVPVKIPIFRPYPVPHFVPHPVVVNPPVHLHHSHGWNAHHHHPVPPLPLQPHPHHDHPHHKW